MEKYWGKEAPYNVTYHYKYPPSLCRRSYCTFVYIHFHSLTSLTFAVLQRLIYHNGNLLPTRPVVKHEPTRLFFTCCKLPSNPKNIASPTWSRSASKVRAAMSNSSRVLHKTAIFIKTALVAVLAIDTLDIVR